MGRLDPDTFEWIEDDAASPLPAPVSVPGAAPDQSFNQVAPGSPMGGGGSSEAAPADIDGEGGVLPIPGAVTQKSSGSSGKVATPGVVAAGKQQSAASSLQTSAAVAGAEAETKEAAAKAAKLDREFLEEKVKGIQSEKFIKEHEALEADLRRQTQQKQQEYAEQAKTGTFFEDQSPMRKFLWIVASALGGYGAAKTGRNQPLEMLQKTVEDWSENRVKRLTLASTGVKNAQDWQSKALEDHRKNELEAAPLKKAAAYRIFADVQRKELEANKAHLDSASLARGQKLIADAEALAAKTEMEYQQFLAPTARSASIDQRPGGKPTEASGVGAARAGLIVDTLTDAMSAPGMSADGLRTVNQNEGRKKMAEKAPILDVLTGGRVSPAEGAQQGLSQSDRQAMSRQSVLNETITYLTTGAAASKEEGTSKTAQLQIQPSDDASTRRTKMVNAYRYAKAAAQIGRASMTPEHIERMNDLGRALGEGGAPPVKTGGGGGGEAKPNAQRRQIKNTKTGATKWQREVDGGWQDE